MPEDARDASHLRTLSILHYVYSGLGILVLFFVGLHYSVMQTASKLVTESQTRTKKKREEEAPPSEEGELVVPDTESGSDNLSNGEGAEVQADLFEMIFDSLRWLYLVAVGWILLHMILNFLAARSLSSRRNRVFVIVVSSLNCLSIPFGLALGVFTLIVLSRPSMRVSFNELERST
jgi:hypothetical protein